MSTNLPGDDANLPPEWERMLREMFGADAEEALRELRARGMDPVAMAAASGLPDDPALLGQVLAQVRRLLAATGEGPVNWDIAHDVARQVAATGGDPSLTPKQVRAATEALSVAELWLDSATDLPPAGGPPRVWSRSEWVEQTLSSWRTLTEPVASSLSVALTAVLLEHIADGLSTDPVTPGSKADPAQLIRGLGSVVFGMQVGQAAGALSREVFGATDIGIPLVREPSTVLVPANIAAFAEGLDAPLEEVTLFLALREAAHARLFTHVTWLRGHLLEIVATYARGIAIDSSTLEEAVSSIDPTDPEALQTALSRGVFAPSATPEQEAALTRLETALALVEGWVDEVSAAAAFPHLPHTVALREMLRRRRAAGGPAEETFATLVGLELRPRRSRAAAALWEQIARDGSVSVRDAVWDHPDLLPTAEDLDDPAGYQARRDASAEAHTDLDRALAEIFGEQPPEQSE
jgi:putative hydrolase